MRSPHSSTRRRLVAVVIVAALAAAILAIPKGHHDPMRNLAPPSGRISKPMSAEGILAPYTPTYTMTGTTWTSQTGRYMISNGLIYVWAWANLSTGGGAVAQLTISLPYTVTPALPLAAGNIVGLVTNGASSRADVYNPDGASLRTPSNLTAVGGSVYSVTAVIPILG